MEETSSDRAILKTRVAIESTEKLQSTCSFRDYPEWLKKVNLPSEIKLLGIFNQNCDE